MAGKMKYNAELKKVYDEIKSISSGSFSGFVSGSETAFATLTSSLQNALDSLNIGDTWDDDVKVEINNATCTGINEIINACSTAVTNSVVPAAAKVDSLISTLETYIETVDAYNSALELRDKITVGSEPVRSKYLDDTSYNNAHSAWSARKTNYDAYTQLMDNEESNATKYEGLCKTKINEIKACFGNAEAAAAAQAGSGGKLTPKTKEVKLSDGSTKKITEWYNENGEKVEETYQVVSQDGRVVEVGKVDYTDSGKTRSYTTTTDSYTQDVTLVYNDNNQIINSHYDTMYQNGDFSSTDTTYWETTGNMKTFDYIYDSAEGWSLKSHSEFSEQGVRTVGNRTYTGTDKITNTDSSYDALGRETQYVRNEYDPDSHELKCSSLVTRHYDGDSEQSTGYTYNSGYPDGSSSTQEYLYDPPGSYTPKIQSSVRFQTDGSGEKNTYTYANGKEATRTCELFNSSGERTGVKVFENVYTSTGEWNGYVVKNYDASGEFTGETDCTFGKGD